MEALPAGILLLIAEAAEDPRPLAVSRRLHSIVGELPEYKFLCRYLPTRRNILEHGTEGMYRKLKQRQLTQGEYFSLCRNPSVEIVKVYIHSGRDDPYLSCLLAAALECGRADILLLCMRSVTRVHLPPGLNWYRVDSAAIKVALENCSIDAQHRDIINEILFVAVTRADYHIISLILGQRSPRCSDGILKGARVAARQDNLRMFSLFALHIESGNLLDILARRDNLRLLIWARDNRLVPDCTISLGGSLIVSQDAAKIYTWAVRERLWIDSREGTLRDAIEQDARNIIRAIWELSHDRALFAEASLEFSEDDLAAETLRELLK